MDNNLQLKNEYFAKREEKERAAQEQRRKKIIKKASGWLVVLVGLGMLVLIV